MILILVEFLGGALPPTSNEKCALYSPGVHQHTQDDILKFLNMPRENLHLKVLRSFFELQETRLSSRFLSYAGRIN